MSQQSIPIARRQVTIGTVTGMSLLFVFSAAMLPWRSHLDGATVALVLVVPVVSAVVVGGGMAGAGTVLTGFLVYDLVFIKPYYRLTVGTPRDWVALVVYVIVVSLVGRVVDRMRSAERAARSRQADTQLLLDLSELLIQDRPLEQLLPLIVTSVKEAFACEAVVLLLPRNEHLEVVAAAGRELTTEELARISPGPGSPGTLVASLNRGEGGAETDTIVLSSPDRPVGLLGLVGAEVRPQLRQMTAAFANHLAVAIERSELQGQVLKLRVLEQVDQLRGRLVAAVSHDLRTPLTTIMASASTLRDAGEAVGTDDRLELLDLIDNQADRLSRLVTNLLDLSRIDTGALQADLQPMDVRDLVGEAIAALRPESRTCVLIEIDAGKFVVQADHVLTVQIIINLLENAVRYSPGVSSVQVSAATTTTAADECLHVEIVVADRGPGIAEDDQAGILGLGRSLKVTGRDSSPGGSGVGLTIARAFAEAQGGSLHIDTTARIGARVVLTLLAAP